VGVASRRISVRSFVVIRAAGFALPRALPCALPWRVLNQALSSYSKTSLPKREATLIQAANAVPK